MLRYYHNTFLYQCHKSIWEEDYRNYVSIHRKTIIGRNRANQNVVDQVKDRQENASQRKILLSAEASHNKKCLIPHLKNIKTDDVGNYAELAVKQCKTNRYIKCRDHLARTMVKFDIHI